MKQNNLLEEALDKIKQEKRRGGKWVNFRHSVYKRVIPDLVRLGYGYRIQDGASHFTITF